MRERAAFPSINLSWLNSFKPEEVEAYLELLPFACVAIDDRNGNITWANSKFCEISHYGLSDLIHLNASDVGLAISQIPKSAVPMKPAQASDGVISALIQQEQSAVAVHSAATKMPGRKGQSLILLDIINPQAGSPDLGQSDLIWENLDKMVRAPEQDKEEAAIQQVLEAAQLVVQASLVIFYRISPNRPVVHRMASVGNADLLPLEVPTQDLSYLKKPRLWTGSKHPGCNLHSIAMNNHLSYLASSPVGQGQALVGLLVLGGQADATGGLAARVSNLAASSLATILQVCTRRAGLSSQVSQLEARLHTNAALFENIREGVILLDNQLRIIQINRTAEGMLGYNSREISGQPIQKVLIGSSALEPALVAAQKGSPTYNLKDESFYRRDGAPFVASLRIFPIRHKNRDGNILVLIQDLSEQEQIRSQAQLLEQQANLGEITAIFSHEVRNPINNISTGLQLIAYNLPEGDPNQEAVQRMLQDCDRLNELVKWTLSFSKPTEYKMEVIDLAMILNRLIARSQASLAKQKIECDLQIEAGPTTIRGDFRALEQVFNNLITNAVQAMSEGGKLVIKISPSFSNEGRAYVEISVADTGPGIPKEHQEQIFLPYFTTKHQGTGLGLPIVKRIITAHKGNIRLTSFPGGTIFHIQLPAVNS